MNSADPAREAAFLVAVETHSVADLRGVLAAGLSATAPLQGKSPLQWLLEMYMRSDQFAACVQLLLDHGAAIDDPGLAAVLLDDAAALRAALTADQGLLRRRFDVVAAFTPLLGASLLHIAAEYGHRRVTAVLLAMGADVEAGAALDGQGGDGQTALFHTVSSLLDHGAAVMNLLLAAGARIDVRLPMLTWGRGQAWETTLYDVTPISYCQAGLLPQMHRREGDIYRNLGALLAAGKRAAPSLANVPNRYLLPRR